MLAEKRDTVRYTVSNQPYMTAAEASRILSDGTGYTSVQAYTRLMMWRNAGTLRTKRVHEKFHLYLEADVLILRDTLRDTQHTRDA
jgi:hypothetical protein